MSGATGRPVEAAGGLLEVTGLVVDYAEVRALDGVELICRPGEVTAVIGPNGAGKSTLLRAVLGLVAPTAGTIRLDGEPVGTARGRIAWVPQRSTIDVSFPVTALDVACMTRTVRRGLLAWRRPADRAAGTDALARVGAGHLAGRVVGELSGGQLQRTLVARALAQDGDVLVCDEPLAGLDPTTSLDLERLLRAEADVGRTIVLVEHDLDAVRRVADVVALLDRKVLACGPPGEVLAGDDLPRLFRMGGAAL